MSKTADPESIQRAALAFYQWYRGGEPDEGSLLALQHFLGVPLQLGKFRQFGERLRSNRAFLESQEPLVAKWQERMDCGEAISEHEAEAFIQELFDSFDHALLFDQGIAANSTYTQRGFVSDSEMHFAGNMPCWTLHLTLRGRALFISDALEQEVGPGAMMLFRPDAAYHYGRHPKTDEWEHLWAIFQPRSAWGELLEWSGRGRDIQCLMLPDEASLKQMEQVFRQLIELGEDAGAYKSELQHNRLEELLIRARQHSTAQEHGFADRRIQQACDYMQDRLCDKFHIEDVAAACNLSVSRLAHLFKEQMGVGPKTWINNARLQQARRLLLNTETRISEIGARVGYDDPAHFSRYFSKNMGCSPKQFRQSSASQA